MVGRGGKSRKVVWFDFPFFYDAVNVVFVAVKCFNAQKRKDILGYLQKIVEERI